MRKNRARPDPVSCQSCRSKKLKCNRVQPCSNCNTRGITCIFLSPLQRHADRTSGVHDSAEILERIERLETIVLEQAGITDTRPAYSSNSHVPRQQPCHSSTLIRRGTKIHDCWRMLEREKIRLQLLCLSNGLTFKVKSIREILEMQPSPQYPTPVSDYDRSNDTVVTFPIYTLANLLCESYESRVHHLCNILHIPTVRSLIRTVHLRISQNESILPSQAALLLSIFAIAAYFYQPFNGSEVSSTKIDTIHLSRIFSRNALDVLDFSRRNTSGTLKDVQASILMSVVTYHIDGFSARGRLLMTTAISIARELRLHRLDAENESTTTENETSFCVLIDREIKRRVFWHIASTDWLLSTISGPQEGMYFIHPDHVSVRPPKDSSDDDLVLGEENQPKIGPRPTDMSFFLERLRLAHLCREMADTVPLETSKLMQIPYGQIVALDQKLQDYLSNLPFFFKLDPESRRRTEPIEIMYPGIPVTRYCITTEAHSRRCKLHQRFLLRQAVDSRYTYSRQACLESARAVVRSFENIHEYDSLSTVPELMGTAVHFTHLALVVMVMDLCFNRNETDEAEIKAEVTAALQLFENAQNTSPLLNRFFSSLNEVLQKHKVHLTDLSSSATKRFDGFANGLSPDTFNDMPDDDQMQFTQPAAGLQETGLSLNTSFDEFWQIAMQGEPTSDSLTWDNLFSALDSRVL